MSFVEGNKLTVEFDKAGEKRVIDQFVARGTVNAPPLWKASIALEKMRAPDMASLFELASEPQAVLIVEEPFGPGAVVEALYTDEPDARISAKLAGRDVTVEPLPDQDWIELSQRACRRCGPGASSSMARMMPASCRMA